MPLPPSVAFACQIHIPLPASEARVATRGAAGGATGSWLSGTNTAGVHGWTAVPGLGGGGGHPGNGVAIAATAGPKVVVVVERGTNTGPPTTWGWRGVVPEERETP